ncbi:MAG: hypothetical protein E6L04_11225 [Thaumarchaeota archaeon]|nr:MAG: hypothetical protein E6L04_11225 [Nitrososphaerota archaeon]
MKPYLDTEDTFYFNYEELIKVSKIITNLAELKAELEPKQKPKKDYAGIGAVIITFTVMSIVIGLSIYTAWQVAYGINQTDTLERDTTAYMDTPKEFEQARTERHLQGCYSGFAILGNLYNNYYFKTIPLAPQELEKFIKDMCH